MSDDTPPHRAPAAEDVFGSAETLMTRFTTQLTVQLAHLRPFPDPDEAPAAAPADSPAAPAAAGHRPRAPERA